MLSKPYYAVINLIIQRQPLWPGINDVTKYVFSSTPKHSEWNASVFIDSIADIEKLKKSDGSEPKVWGTSKLFQLFLSRDMGDELWLMIHPLALGRGKKLFQDGPIPAGFCINRKHSDDQRCYYC